MEPFETSSDKKNEKRRRPKVIACIPAYNQEQSIGKLVLATLKYVDHVIVTDDGSFDKAADTAEYSLKALRTILASLSDSGFGLITESLAEASRYKLPIVEVPVVIRYGTGLPTSKKQNTRYQTQRSLS